MQSAPAPQRASLEKPLYISPLGSESGEPDAAALEDYLGVEHYLELSFPAHLRPRSEEKKKEARCQPSSYSSLNACATPSPPLVAEA